MVIEYKSIGGQVRN